MREDRMMELGYQALNHALKLIEKRFENGPRDNRLAYHRRKHTVGVVLRTEKIARAIGLPALEYLLGVIMGSFHDTVQEWVAIERKDGSIFRQRKTGKNENGSGQEAIEWMKKQKDVIFTDRDYELVHMGCMVTVPSWSIEYGTVIQAALTPESHPVIRAVALADIGSPGMDPIGFGEDGDFLFAEQELDIMAALLMAKKPGDISSEKQKEYLTRYFAWLNSQIGFARGRQRLFETELGNLSEENKENVRNLFSYFPESIRVAEKNAEDAKTCHFEVMAKRLLLNNFYSN